MRVKLGTSEIFVMSKGLYLSSFFQIRWSGRTSKRKGALPVWVLDLDCFNSQFAVWKMRIVAFILVDTREMVPSFILNN